MDNWAKGILIHTLLLVGINGRDAAFRIYLRFLYCFSNGICKGIFCETVKWTSAQLIGGMDV